MINYSVNNRHHIIGAGVQAHGGMWPSAASSNWWEAGGATGAVAVYQPKGAASYAASLVNLANPGTYNAVEGTAPTWDAGTGWTFDGSTQHLLISALVFPTTQTWTWLVRYQDWGTGTYNGVWGFYFGSDGTREIGLNRAGVATETRFSNHGNYTHSQVASGVVGAAGGTAYVNGASVRSITDKSGYPPLGGDAPIGARRYADGRILGHSNVKVYAFAIYNNTLDATKVAAVSAAMAAL
jgi:hypothetical protein